MTTENVLDNAMWFAYEAHKGQFRKHLPEPYIFHPVAVAQDAQRHGLGLDEQVAGFLHDVPEDCCIDIDDMPWNQFGGSRPRMLVEALTNPWAHSGKPSHNEIAGHYGRILKIDGARRLKVIDRTRNLLDLVRALDLNGPAISIWAQAYISKTINYVTPLAARCFREDDVAIGIEFYEALGKAQGAISIAALLR